MCQRKSMGIWNTLFHKQGLQKHSSFVFCFKLCPDSLHTSYCILGSPCAPSPSCSNSSFLPFLFSLYFPKLIPVFLPSFLIAAAQPCASTVHWLAHRHTPIAHTADFAAETEVFLSISWNLGLSPFTSCLAVFTKTTNLHNFEINEFTRVLLEVQSILLGGPSLVLGRASRFPQPLKPVRHQHSHRSNRYAVLPQTALITNKLLNKYPPNSSKQMTCFTLYSLFPPSQALPFYYPQRLPNKQPSLFSLSSPALVLLTLYPYLLILIQLPWYFLLWSSVLFN